MATETARLILMILLALSAIWVIVCVVRNDMATIIRALVVTVLVGLAFFYVNQTKLQTLTLDAVKDDIFPAKTEYFTFNKRETTAGGVLTTTYIFSEPGPRLKLSMEKGGKFLTISDIRPLNRVLAYVGLPPVKNGVRELAAVTGSTLDANLYRWDNYDLGVLTIERGICRNITTTESFPCISSITVKAR
jgi:hypothetical protein